MEQWQQKQQQTQIEEKFVKDLPKQRKQCRICLEGEDEGRMLSPCLCTGSVSYAHEHCLKEWIKRKQEIDRKLKVSCEMCQTAFIYKVACIRTLRCEEFCQNYEKEKSNFRNFFISLSLVLFLWVGLIVLVGNSTSDSQFGFYIKSSIIKTENIRIIYICAIFILFIVLLFMIILFLIEYAVHSELTVHEIRNYNEPTIKRAAKIHPKTII